jgi:hypothetical protein
LSGPAVTSVRIGRPRMGGPAGSLAQLVADHELTNEELAQAARVTRGAINLLFLRERGIGRSKLSPATRKKYQRIFDRVLRDRAIQEHLLADQLISIGTAMKMKSAAVGDNTAAQEGGHSHDRLHQTQ